MAIAAHAMHARFRLKMLLIAVINEGVEASGGFQIDMTAASAITAIGAAEGNILFPTEGNTSAAARSGLYEDLGLVEKFHTALFRPPRWLWLA